MKESHQFQDEIFLTLPRFCCILKQNKNRCTTVIYMVVDLVPFKIVGFTTFSDILLQSSRRAKIFYMFTLSFEVDAFYPFFGHTINRMDFQCIKFDIIVQSDNVERQH